MRTLEILQVALCLVCVSKERQRDGHGVDGCSWPSSRLKSSYWEEDTAQQQEEPQDDGISADSLQAKAHLFTI